MEQDKLLNDYSPEERSAYLKAVTALATADRTASDEEKELLTMIAESANIPAEDIDNILSAAGHPNTEKEFQQSLDILKNSELRFSLMTDLLAFAESDNTVTPEEKQYLEKVAAHLNINQQQFSTINQFVNKTADAEVRQQATSEPQGFLESIGMNNQFNNAGMNFGNISKGLLGMLGPILLGKLMGRNTGGGSGLGGLLGGLTGRGGLGGMLGGSGSGGGLGSLISMLNGGKGMGNIGGMLGRMFGR